MSDGKLLKLTRRGLLRAGVAAGVTGPLPALLVGNGFAAVPTSNANDYLTAAKLAAQWIRSAPGVEGSRDRLASRSRSS